ncbi:hypothetical protein GCM10023208_30530 [Erythrobacter westpacificensis]|uniref:Replication protein n=1 Tax=Erythrobacter westpacificensis TaxID=1055231 RepID=A0ABP9KNR8_9SPHN
MVDRYNSFAELAANERRGIDYRIRVVDRGANFTILAPHGGTIEPGTSEIAERIAGTEFNLYSFEALRNGPHGDFHITSHRFDEPEALDLLQASWTAIAIHGRQDDGTETVWLGGLSDALRNAIGHSLRSQGFAAEPNRRLPGQSPKNICNRALSGEGVQLELPRSLRRRLVREADLMQSFSGAIQDVASPLLNP